MKTLPLPESPRESRFTGSRLSDLLGVPRLEGVFDDDTWPLARHPHMASTSALANVSWMRVPVEFREALKELVVLATAPELHAGLDSKLLAREPRNLMTVVRWLQTLPIDLAWIRERAGTLTAARQGDFEAWKMGSGFAIDHRRVRALEAFAAYSTAMSPDVERLTAEPWPARSALAVAGGKKRRRANTTMPLDVAHYGRWLVAAGFVVEHADQFLDAVTGENTATLVEPLIQPWLDEHKNLLSRNGLRAMVAGSCIFVTGAFTGMRLGELQAIPRHPQLSTIEVSGDRRWLLTSCLVKGLPVPRREQWLIPPLVAEAVVAMTQLLERCNIPDDEPFLPTGHPPLFDRRALARLSKESTKTTMRLERAIEAVGRASAVLASLGVCEPVPSPAPNGREMRRTFARIVASRPQGPQAAMEQFKWQRAETAAGYFRISTEAPALAQRELYEEVRELQAAVVTGTAVREYQLWERSVERDCAATFPAGPDGLRKQAAFASIRAAIVGAPRVVEDDRRLRALLEPHVDSIYLTEFGFCDYDERHQLCGGLGGPNPAMCQPNACLNASTLSTTVAAHRVKHDRLVALSRDRRLPDLARKRIRREAEAIEKDLGRALRDSADG